MKHIWNCIIFKNGGGIETLNISAYKYNNIEQKRIKKYLRSKLDKNSACAYAYYVTCLPFSKRFGILFKNRSVYVNKAGLEF